MKPLTFTIHRSDGDILKLDGVAGVAVVMQSEYIPEADPSDEERVKGMMAHMPVVSMRASNSGQLAMILATLIATVRAHAPEALEPAMALSTMINAADPELQRDLPPREEK